MKNKDIDGNKQTNNQPTKEGKKQTKKQDPEKKQFNFETLR